ncbi:gem-associated protein 6-like [Salarias fasciatus]|uniref:Gem-associated protein 6 n=1 Tax=Salarias fasciatus TaxID=181472 RepID=A0A672FI71_SALFA|nr:gem-associated protein 6-like [Salarias fasciatus]
MPHDWLLLGPLQWFSYVHKQVKVKLGRDEEHRGWLVTVDPVSASLVLVNFTERGASVRVVMGHAVEEVEVLREADPETTELLCTYFLPLETPKLDPEDLKRRRECVRRWLEKNRLPVEENGNELRVAGVLTITAPYGPEDCCSSNQIILDRIQRLIRTYRDLPQTDPDHPQTHRDILQTSTD